jgi:starch phosphorylase
MEEVKKCPEDDSKRNALSSGRGDENNDVHMTYLAMACYKGITDVAPMHSELGKLLFLLFTQMYPENFTNLTSGVTPRPWIRYCNPSL